MKLPLQMTFRDIEPTDAIKQYIQTRVKKLDSLDPHIMKCRVVVEAPHRHQGHGRHYRVHLDLTVPRAELVVDHDLSRHKGFEDLYAAIDETFAEMKRQLEDAVRVRRSLVKRHENPLQQGRVTKLFGESGYGFLERRGGEEVYFHKNSVLHGDFAKLEVGQPVRFVEEPGEQGPQASTVIAR